MFKKIMRYVRPWQILLAVIASAVAILHQVHTWDTVPHARVELDARWYGYMKPDFDLKEDLDLMGIEARNDKVLGMSHNDLYMGQIHNRGSKDATEVEIKIPVDAVMAYSRASGTLERPRATDHKSVSLTPNDFAKLGDLKAGDNPFAFGIFCSQAAPVDKFTLRYKEDDARYTVEYLVRPTYDERWGQRTTINRVILWGMDRKQLTTLALNTGYVLLGVTAVGVLLNYFGHYVWRLLPIPTITWQQPTTSQPPANQATRAQPPHNSPPPPHGGNQPGKKKRKSK